MISASDDLVWKHQNLVHMVHLAAIHLDGKAETFRWRDLVKATRNFACDRALKEELIADVLREAKVEADWEKQSLRLVRTLEPTA